jgi:hypothetical protein
MNRHHSLALLLVGWFLMMPPMAGDLDLTCQDHRMFAISDFAVGLTTWTSPRTTNKRRCDELRHSPNQEVPLRSWKQVGEFESLTACQAAYDKEQLGSGPPAKMVEDNASLELHDEGDPHPSAPELQKRADLISSAISAQVAWKRCIAANAN